MQGDKPEAIEASGGPVEGGIASHYYEADLALLDRYQAFSAELLRVSLLGIAAIGFFIEKLRPVLVPPAAAWFAVLGFGTAAAFALGHRYYSSDGFFYHLRSARREGAAQKERQTRNRLYRRSGRFLLASVVLAAVGAVSLSVLVLSALLAAPSPGSHS